MVAEDDVELVFAEGATLAGIAQHLFDVAVDLPELSSVFLDAHGGLVDLQVPQARTHRGRELIGVDGIGRITELAPEVPEVPGDGRQREREDPADEQWPRGTGL
jgi:hypothetical protein